MRQNAANLYSSIHAHDNASDNASHRPDHTTTHTPQLSQHSPHLGFFYALEKPLLLWGGALIPPPSAGVLPLQLAPDLPDVLAHDATFLETAVEIAVTEIVTFNVIIAISTGSAIRGCLGCGCVGSLV